MMQKSWLKKNITKLISKYISMQSKHYPEALEQLITFFLFILNAADKYSKTKSMLLLVRHPSQLSFYS